MVLSLWEIFERAKSDPLLDEKQFNLSIFKKTQELREKYDIRYDSEKPPDIEGDLADRVYQAGV